MHRCSFGWFAELERMSTTSEMHEKCKRTTRGIFAKWQGYSLEKLSLLFVDFCRTLLIRIENTTGSFFDFSRIVFASCSQSNECSVQRRSSLIGFELTNLQESAVSKCANASDRQGHLNRFSSPREILEHPRQNVNRQNVDRHHHF